MKRITLLFFATPLLFAATACGSDIKLVKDTDEVITHYKYNSSDTIQSYKDAQTIEMFKELLQKRNQHPDVSLIGDTIGQINFLSKGNKLLTITLRENGGGNVLGYGTLATAYKSGYKQASTIDATEENLKLFSDKFGDKGKEEIVNIFKKYKYEKFEEFSDRTLEWFLLFNNTGNIRNRVEDAEKSIYEYKRLQVEEGYKPYQSKSNNSGNSSRNSKKREDIKVIVAGGRDFTNYKFVQDKLDTLLRNRKDDSNITLYSGTASGTDKLGERYATNRKYSLKTFPANWKDFGRSAGPIRNTEMVKEATHLVR